MVLADRGFTIHDLLAEKGATLEIPPFREGRKQFTKEETIRSKLLSRARIHVERFNERIKKYRIISGIVPLSLPLESFHALSFPDLARIRPDRLGIVIKVLVLGETSANKQLTPRPRICIPSATSFRFAAPSDPIVLGNPATLNVVHA